MTGRRRVGAIAAVAALLFVLAACGSAATPGRSTSTAATSSSASATSAASSTQATSPTPSRTVIRASITPWRLPAPVYRTVAVAVGQRVLVLGGHDTAGGTVSDVYELNAGTGRSRIAGQLAAPTHGSAAALLNRRPLVFGGASTSVHDLVQWFDPARRRATVIGHMPFMRADVTAAVVGNTAVLVGGFDGVGPQGDVWATTDGRRFHVVARLPQPVRYPAAVAEGGDVYVFGGLIAGGEYNGTFSNLVQRVSLRSRSARVVGRLPAHLAHAMGALLGGHPYVFGGSTPSSTSAAILRFDPSSGRVIRVGHLPLPLTDAAVATVGDSAYLLGGISTQPLQPLAGVIAVRLVQA